MSIDLPTRPPQPRSRTTQASRRLVTEVLVIGGGATGSGVARDLAMRGFKTTLVERRDFSHGTTGRFHGLLHSGGRYAAKDPLAARECIEENRILRRIMPHCLEDTGGFFVVTPWDDPDYAQRFLAGCQQATIPVEEISIAEMLRAEPLLNPRISRCFRLPDASADSFLATETNILSAREHGATILNYHQVLELFLENHTVAGARCQDVIKDEEVHIDADLVVIAAGAWSGRIAATANLPVQIIAGKGTMLAANQRIVNTVINRCKLPSDGDILVPAHTVAVIGTTDIRVEDAGHFSIEPWEVRLLLEEGEKLVPGFKEMRMLRAWAGVRPLYQDSAVTGNRDVTRAFALLDHEVRDGIAGVVTITSGKWTTYRKMAEATADLVCRKLGVARPCRTHLEALPETGKHGYHTLGARLKRIEENRAFRRLVCECELATCEDVLAAITQGEAETLDDIRRDVRLGKGPCQGGFCTLRAAGLLHTQHPLPVEDTNVALRDFLQERWKGLLPILWGQQLRQERLDELIYRSLLNADHLPGPEFSRLKAEPYAEPAQTLEPAQPATSSASSGAQLEKPIPEHLPESDLLVIGAGLAGLTSAWLAASRGKNVTLLSKGWGATHWHAGCIDVLGYAPGEEAQPVESPRQALENLVREHPEHPYALVGLARLEEILSALVTLSRQVGYPLLGSLDKNWWLPTGLGTYRPTCLAPQSMLHGEVRERQPMLIVGINGFIDLFPEYVAANLHAQNIPARPLDLKVKSLEAQASLTARLLAERFDTQEFRAEVIASLKAQIKPEDLHAVKRIGFPAVLGLDHAPEVQAHLEGELGSPVFEIPSLPPSIPGIRLQRMLVKAITALQGKVYEGMAVLSAQVENGSCRGVWSESAARQRPHRARHYLLASGGILGGGILARYDQTLLEPIFDLPLSSPASPDQWFERTYLSPRGHPIFQAGIRVNPHMQPIDQAGAPILDNLTIAGALLAGCDVLLERSLEGVALASAYQAVQQAIQ